MRLEGGEVLALARNLAPGAPKQQRVIALALEMLPADVALRLACIPVVTVDRRTLGMAAEVGPGPVAFLFDAPDGWMVRDRDLATVLIHEWTHVELGHVGRLDISPIQKEIECVEQMHAWGVTEGPGADMESALVASTASWWAALAIPAPIPRADDTRNGARAALVVEQTNTWQALRASFDENQKTLWARYCELQERIGVVE